MDSFRTLTTMKIGGVALHVERPRSHDEFGVVLSRLSGSPFLILGGGSNVLARDEDYEGTVVIPSFTHIDFEDEMVIADAGASWDSLVAESVARELWGLENLSGIPGTVGGAVVANIGAYGAALSDTLVSVEVFDTVRHTRSTLAAGECGAAYRTTIFKKEPERYGILRATLRLSKEARRNLSYRDLAERFGKGGEPALNEIRAAVLVIRSGKFPDLAHFGTAGSFFLNPIISHLDEERMRALFPGMPLFTLPEGGVKVPLAWILDHVLDVKGMREGGAFLWQAQPLVIATEQGATSRDVHVLAQKVSELVKEKTSLVIAPEVRML